MAKPVNEWEVRR